MKNFKLFLKALFVVSMIFGLSACGDKEKKSASVTRNTGRTNPNVINPGINNVNVQSSSIGRILANGDMTATVADFLGVDSNMISTINGYNNTGIVFDGNVNLTQDQGQITLYIWDTYAVQTNQVIRVTMNYSGLLQNGEMYFQDNFGGLILDGRVTGNVFSGTVFYTVNGNNQSQYLGNFEINAQSFIRY